MNITDYGPLKETKSHFDSDFYITLTHALSRLILRKFRFTGIMRWNLYTSRRDA